MNDDMMSGEWQEEATPDLGAARKHFSRLGLMYFLGTLIIFGTQMLGNVVILLNPEWQQNINAVLLLTMLPMYIIGMPIMVLLVRRVPAVKPGTHKMKLGSLFVAFLMCYAIMYLSNIVGNIVTTIISAIKGSAVGNPIVDLAANISPWVSILTMVVIAPIWEEILFRKLLVDRMVKYGQGVAIAVSALMFGFFHGNLNQFAYAFTLGLFLSFIYVKTGKIIYTVILHMVINFMGSVLSIWVLEASDYHTLMASFESGSPDMSILPKVMILLVYFVLLIAIVIAGTVLLIVKKKRFTVSPGEIVIPKGKKFSTVILNLGMILFAVFWIGMMIYQVFI